MKIKTKISIWDLIKHKSTAKERINRTKRQPTEWEKIFINEPVNKGLISKTYKQLMQLHIKKPQTQSKIGRRSKQTFLQRHTNDQKAHEKRLSITNY